MIVTLWRNTGLAMTTTSVVSKHNSDPAETEVFRIALVENYVLTG